VGYRHNLATPPPLELLQGDFESGLASDDDDNPFTDVTTIGAQLAIAF
jgi:hypothetical protein